METETIDKLFWELSQFSNVMTAREMQLSRELGEAQVELAELRADAAKAKANERDAERWRKVEKLAMDVNPLGRFHSFGSDVFNLVLEDTP